MNPLEKNFSNPKEIIQIMSFKHCKCYDIKKGSLTAPVTRHISINTERYHTAPSTRETLHAECPTRHILVTFRSPAEPDETYKKAFPADTKIEYIKNKLSNLLSISTSNLVLTKNRHVLKDATLLSEIKSDTLGNATMDIFTIDGEDFNLSSIPKISFVKELLDVEKIKKKEIPFIAVKFKITNQNQKFTRSYHSKTLIHEIKKNLAGIFQLNPDNIVLLRNDSPLKDRMALLDIDYDQYGIVDVECLTKSNETIDIHKLYKEFPMNAIIKVHVPFGDTKKEISVEIYSDPIDKPYMGGYRNIHTGQIYHHAYTQTPQKKEKVAPEMKNCRDTQTAEMREKVLDMPYSRATQMDSETCYIPNVTDRVIISKPYETYIDKVIRENRPYYATKIQRAFRHYQFRKKVYRWLDECRWRIEKMKEEDRREQEAIEKRIRRDLITKTFPRTRQDFDQLYAMVDQWKENEINRISSLHAKGPKIAEFTLLLDKEVELLRCIEDYRIKVRQDHKKLRDKAFLEGLAKPISWFGRDGKIISMETIEIQHAKKLKELYNAFVRTDLNLEERLELIVDLRNALIGFNHYMTAEIITLLDQEADLIVRRYTNHQLEFLRKRTAACILQFVKTSELNAGVTKCKDIRDYRKMQRKQLYLCEMCYKVKHHSDFPLHNNMTSFIVCKSCSWKEVSERLWIDMSPFNFILRSVQREERKRKCWGSIAFLLQEKDIYFIVVKLWHSHSAISESTEFAELRLCRWNKDHDWSPWNCFLVTVQEMKAHLKLDNPEEVYDEELVQKVKNKHNLAKAKFEQTIMVNRKFTQTGQWQKIHATAVDYTKGVDPI